MGKNILIFVSYLSLYLYQYIFNDAQFLCTTASRLGYTTNSPETLFHLLNKNLFSFYYMVGFVINDGDTAVSE